MFTQFGQARHGSRVVAWLSVLGLIIAMFAASIDPAEASVQEPTDAAIAVLEAAPDGIGGPADSVVSSVGGSAGDDRATD